MQIVVILKLHSNFSVITGKSFWAGIPPGAINWCLSFFCGFSVELKSGSKFVGYYGIIGKLDGCYFAFNLDD